MIRRTPSSIRSERHFATASVILTINIITVAITVIVIVVVITSIVVTLC